LLSLKKIREIVCILARGIGKEATKAEPNYKDQR
jgi:hypothetical protein